MKLTGKVNAIHEKFRNCVSRISWKFGKFLGNFLRIVFLVEIYLNIEVCS